MTAEDRADQTRRACNNMLYGAVHYRYCPWQTLTQNVHHLDALVDEQRWAADYALDGAA